MGDLPQALDEHETLELVGRLQDGDEQAWQELYRGYRDELLFAIRSRMGPSLRSALQSEDLLQSAALEAFRALPSFTDRGRGSLRAFLHRLVANKIVDRARRLAAGKRRGGVALTDSLAAECAAPESLPQYDDPRYESLERALRRLPEEMAEVIVLRRIEGLSSKEVAERTGRSDAAVRKLFSRAMARLSLLLGEDRMGREP